jgi:hypothetical protein
VVGAGRRREPSLRLPADGCDHLRARPTGKLHRRVAHGTGATRDQDRPAGQRVRPQPRRAVLGNRQRPVRRDGRDTDAGSELNVRGRREREDAFGGDDGKLLRRAARRTAVTGKGDPDPIAYTEAVIPAPTSSTTPAPSWLGTDVSVSSPPNAPLRDFQSVGFTPDTSTRIRTSPSPGWGIGLSTSSGTDGSPRRAYVIARMRASFPGDVASVDAVR